MSTKNSLIHSKKYKAVLSAVHMVYRLVNSTYSVQELCLRLTRVLCQFIEADSSTIFVLDPKGKRLTLKAVFDNRINILVTKKKDLLKISDQEHGVLSGYSLFEKNILALPMVGDEIIGAIFMRRPDHQKPFDEFDKEMLAVIVEVSVTAIKNLQLSEAQQKVILESIKFIGKLIQKQGHKAAIKHTPTYFKIVEELAQKLHIDKDSVYNLFYASILRDAGAIDIPYDILHKGSQLTAEEFKIIRNQPQRSADLIKPVAFLKPVLPIILYHHEHYDGSGYPSGLKKEQIPIGARIMAVADAFLAMISERAYKKRLTFNEAIEELKFHSGTQFDPKVIEAFVELAKQKKFRKILSIDHK